MKKILYQTVIIILAFVTFIWLFYSNRNYPETKDEVVYTLCARSFIEWTKAPNPFSKDVLFRYWDIGYEHPSFVKILSGITWAIFHNKTGELISYRLATIINFSFLIVILYLFSSQYLGRIMAICASIFLLCIPEVIEYAHFAEININLSTLWFLTAVFFLKGLRAKSWIYISGVFFGFALGSKITTFIIPIAILIWCIKYYPQKLGSAYVIFLLFGILIFILSWPSLWFEFSHKLIGHIKFNVSLISNTSSKLWCLALKTFFYSIPPGLLILFIIGAVGVFLERNELGMLSLNIIVIMLVVFSIFYPGEGMRYFLPAVPFVAILCASGFKYLITPVVRRKVIYV